VLPELSVICEPSLAVIVETLLKPVTRVKPAVEAAAKRVGHAVRIVIAERAVEFFGSIGVAVAVVIEVAPDLRDAERDAAVLVRIDPDRDVQVLGERRDLRRASIGADLDDLDLVATLCDRARGRDTRPSR